MGEVVMKNIFDKDNFVFSALDKKQRLQSAIVSVCLAAIFAITAISFMKFLYCLSDCVGSIVCASFDVALRDALRSMPIFLSFFISLGGLLILHEFYRNESP